MVNVREIRFLLLAVVVLFRMVDMSGQENYSVRVFPDRQVSGISDLFWGTNFLYWIEDDSALADSKIETALKELPCRILRYPGGTVADNYHWRTNLLDNHFMFPYEEGPEQSDFDEFMTFCSRVGAEPMLVVNTQSWFLQDDVAGGAREAADWVKYCKDKGYRVKYWEIGNETYWHPVMTAKEYGELVNVYSEAMKEVDPDIIISANGHWDINMVGTKERIPEKYWQDIKQGYSEFSSKEDYAKHKKAYEKLAAKPITSGEAKWWRELLSVCGHNIDMISVHWYYFDPQIPYIDGKIRELLAFVKKVQPEKDYLLCLSEYNCNTDGLELRMPGLAESIGRFLNAGTDIACFWPLRIGGSNSAKGNRNMLGLDSKDEQYPYQILGLFQRNLRGSMVECLSPDDVYAFASRDNDDMTIVVSGRMLTNIANVTVDLQSVLKGKEIKAKLYRSDTKSIGICGEELDLRLRKEKVVFTIEPESFVMLTIRKSEKL